MGHLVEVILSDDAAIRDKSLDHFCSSSTLETLLLECAELDVFRRQSTSLYHKVRALFFLYGIHRFHILTRDDIDRAGLITYVAYEHLLKRRFEQAIDIFLDIQKQHGPNEGISSGLAEAYQRLGFQTLANQVRYSVRHTLGNQWMFRCGHPNDHPLAVRNELIEPDPKTGLFPILNESTPVRMDITHSGWSDIFFLGMDYPEGAKVLNISVNLQIYKKGTTQRPRPPIQTYFRVIDQPLIRLTSIDLEASTDITSLDAIFDFAKDYLGLLKAAIIASGIVPPGMEGSEIPLSDLLDKLVAPGKGFELVSHVNNIPKGSRLAVSTNLLASMISLLMRATSQTHALTGSLRETERRMIAARAILGEWLGGSGGGWQDSGGIWPGIKVIHGVSAEPGDPEYGKSKGRLLPNHLILDDAAVNQDIRNNLQDCLVMVHGGMAQDVGPILEMVTEKYLLRSEKEWSARQESVQLFDDVLHQLKEGKIEEIGTFTQYHFEHPLRRMIPWITNAYTESIIKKVKKEFGKDFWGFWMMGGMSGGGMGFIFHPSIKVLARDKLQVILTETKRSYEHALPFAMDPVVYDYGINEDGSQSSLSSGDAALLPQWYYILKSPSLLKKDINTLTIAQQKELQHLGEKSKSGQQYGQLVTGLYERMIPRTDQEAGTSGSSLSDLLEANGFDREMHQQIKSEYKSGRIGLSQNRLPSSSVIKDVDPSDVDSYDQHIRKRDVEVGYEALKNGRLAIVTLAGGAGSRWTHGAGVVKALHPFISYGGKHRSFLELHLAKNRKIAESVDRSIPHIITTSYLTNDAIKKQLEDYNYFGHHGPVYLSRGHSIGLRLIPMERELRYLWEVLPQQELDIQEQKMKESLHNALIGWARSHGEGENYTDNVPSQCIHPVGHWYEIPNMLLNGTLEKLLSEYPDVQHLLVHNVDTMGANADPGIFGYHLKKNQTMTGELITRRLNDRGGGLANVDGKVRIIEGLALPDEKIEFELSYYNSNTFWIDINKILETFGITRSDLSDGDLLRNAVRSMSRKIPTYITIKDVKKRWGKGQEDIYPVVQFEKLWGDMTALTDVNCNFLTVHRLRGQQLKEISELDGWLRDGSAKYVAELCGYEMN